MLMIQLNQCKINDYFSLSKFSFIYSEQKNFQSRPETYNGAERDLYSWTQTIKDIDVRVKVNFLSIKTFFSK